MWVLEGPFDGENGDLACHKTKLLKTGTSYTLGRKDRPLIVNNKKVSHEHCEFIVGPFKPEDVGDPSVRSRLEFVNKRSKLMKLLRNGKELALNPSTQTELEDGDLITIVTDIQIRIKWEPLCCYIPPSKAQSIPSAALCASLGIYLTQTHGPHVTHHLAPMFTMTVPMAVSLLALCKFARVEWLNEILRLGNLPANNDPVNVVSLEQTFVLPLLSKYRPSFSPHLPPSLKEFKVWEPNEERVNMLTGFRFLFVGEQGREVDTITREMVSRGGGEYEILDVNAASSRWHQAITKGLRRVKDGGRGFSVVCDETAMKTIVGNDGWIEKHNILESCGLRCITIRKIVEAVIDVDVSRMETAPHAVGDGNFIDSTPQSSFVPNTFSAEPSLLPSDALIPHDSQKSQERPPAEAEQEAAKLPIRRLTRRATSRQPSQEPVSAKTPLSSSDLAMDPPSEPPRSRRTLTRRAKESGTPLIIGIDDPSAIISVSETTTVHTPSTQTQTQPRPSRLKRRVGASANAPEAQLFAISAPPEEDAEPPLKKFKALFEASDPDRITNMNEQYYGTQTQTSTDTSDGQSHRVIGSSDIREEEESQSVVDVTQTLGARGTKRKAPLCTTEDDAIGDSVYNSGTTKKRVLEHPAVIGRQLDQDLTFLKAVASVAKVAATNGEIDVDFKKLRISRPDLEDEARQWAVLGEFGDDSNLRGNFMVVVEMDLLRKGHFTPSATNVEWHNVPNFKKFKKKANEVQRRSIALVMNGDTDYGAGAAYWKGDNPGDQMPPSQEPWANSINHVQSQPLVTHEHSKKKSVIRPSEESNLFLKDSDDDGNSIDDKEDDAADIGDKEASDCNSMLKSSLGLSKLSKKKVVMAGIVDDDSDDEAVFKGFRVT